MKERKRGYRKSNLHDITKFKHKEVRKVMDWMKSLADPPDSFEVTLNSHYKVRFTRYNRSGELVSFFLVHSSTPSKNGSSKSLRSTVRQHAVMNDVDLSPDYWKDRDAA